MSPQVLTGSQPEVSRPAHPLDVFFSPAAVAVFGASHTPGSMGRAVMSNLILSPFGGTLFPINPRWPGVLGVKAYPCLADVPVPVDLAVVAAPPPAVPGILHECA